METFGSIIVSALLIEAIVNIIKNIKDKEKAWQYWASLGLSVALSVLVSYNWNLDLFKIVGLPDGRIPFVGSILTGLILSRGSNVVSDLIGLINRGKTNQGQ